MRELITLPNGTTTSVDENGRINVLVCVSAHEMIGADAEGFNEMLSIRATGSALLGDVAYKFSRAFDDNTLTMYVSGTVSRCWQ
ncbi:hypothetical protein BcepSauron_038 [Burkholderia phage BcepSauron]|uniref:Uncharacterized protein n=1 Tax=Burkholderia phage BcepSauron TaxID=2530033 RepID=A0A482MLB5_9CAUD|nr:hypothetical protein H1O17_gp038 [Burkholderia phage BcepSauron]QBQ74418.1 hypothetical protein BcepSauron_038 [Burkholderia phage BcepSauron]